MTKERKIWVEGCLYHVVLSDERETLLAAKAAGRVAVGLLPSAETDAGEPLPVRYLTDDPDVDPQWLERVVRREKKLPWTITESQRLMIREFTMEDIGHVVQETSDGPEDAVFYTPKLLKAYIRSQYEFYECGMWALVRKCDGRLIGKAGAVMADASEECDAADQIQMELGYHVFEPYRRQGYAGEACRAIVSYLKREYGNDVQICARVQADNLPSIRLLKSLGFIVRKCSGSELLHFRYVP